MPDHSIRRDDWFPELVLLKLFWRDNQTVNTHSCMFHQPTLCANSAQTTTGLTNSHSSGEKRENPDFQIQFLHGIMVPLAFFYPGAQSQMDCAACTLTGKKW
jgi:hypothetical protein